MLTIHAFPSSPRGFKVLSFANHIAIPYEFKLVDLTKGEQTQPGYVAINPNKRMPSLTDGDFTLWESNAILVYLATLKPDAGFLPADPKGHADVLRWMFWESCSFDPACAILIFENFVKGFFGRGAPDPAEVEKGTAQFNKFAGVLDAHLSGRKWVCGDSLTIADFSLAAPLTMTEGGKLPVEPFGEIKRWYAQMAALPAWAKTAAMAARPTA